LLLFYWQLVTEPTIEHTWSLFKLERHSARTGRTVFSQPSAAVLRRKENDGVVYAIRAWFKYDTALSAVV